MSRGKSTDTIFSNVIGKGSKGEESINKPVTFLQREPGWFVLVQVIMRLGYRTRLLSPSVYCSSGSQGPPYILFPDFGDIALCSYRLQISHSSSSYSISIVNINSNPLKIVKFIVNIPVQLQSILPYSNPSLIPSILLYFLSYFSDNVWFKIHLISSKSYCFVFLFYPVITKPINCRVIQRNKIWLIS